MLSILWDIVLYDTLEIHSSPFLSTKNFNSAVDLCSTACPVNQCMWQRHTDKLFWIPQFKKCIFSSIKPLQILRENWANIYWKWDLRMAVFFVYKIKLVKKVRFFKNSFSFIYMKSLIKQYYNYNVLIYHCSVPFFPRIYLICMSPKTPLFY